VSENKILVVGADNSNSGFFKKINSALPADWESLNCTNGKEGLEALENSSIAAILCCEKLPDMTGLEMLEKASGHYSDTIRLLFMSEVNPRVVRESSAYIDQHLSFSTQPEAVVKTLENSLNLRKLLINDQLRSTIDSIESLPSLPETYNKIVAELKSENVSIRNISELVSKDISITAKLLQMVNSAYFGLSTRVESVLHATNLLGLNTVQSIVLSAGVFDQFEAPKVKNYSVESIYNRSIAVGAKARLLAHAFGLAPRYSEDALLSGMLHDIGKLVMLRDFSDEFAEIIEIAVSDSIPINIAQEKIMGTNDAAIGGYLLARWGLSDSIVEAVTLHYTPSNCPNPLLNALTAVHVAFAMDLDEEKNIRDDSVSSADKEYLKKIGIAEQMPSFRGFCAGAVV